MPIKRQDSKPVPSYTLYILLIAGMILVIFGLALLYYIRIFKKPRTRESIKLKKRKNKRKPLPPEKELKTESTL